VKTRLNPPLPYPAIQMLRILCLLILAMLALHQDNWFWTDGRLVFGFLPVGLFYHACLSIMAALMWWWATQFCWPKDSTEDASEGASS